MPYVLYLIITVKHTVHSLALVFEGSETPFKTFVRCTCTESQGEKTGHCGLFFFTSSQISAMLRSQFWTSLVPEARTDTDVAQMTAALVFIFSDQPPRKNPKPTNQNKPQLLLRDKLKSFPFVSPFPLLSRVWLYLPVTLSPIFFFPGTDLHRKGKKLMPGIIHPVQPSMKTHWPTCLCCSSLCPVPPVAYFLFHMFFSNCPDLTLLLIVIIFLLFCGSTQLLHPHFFS